MSDQVRRGTFAASDLERVDTSRWVVLGSGSPPMTVVTTEGDMCLCEWADDSGKIQRQLYEYWLLRRMVRFRIEDLPFVTDDPFNAAPGTKSK